MVLSTLNPPVPSFDPASQRARVYVIGRQMLMARALSNVLQQDEAIEFVGDAPTANKASLTVASPNIILLDTDSNVDDIADEIAVCRLACPAARIGVLSGHLNADVMQRVLSAGADGYIVKDITTEGLVAAVVAMAGGNLYVDPRLVGSILRKHAGLGRRDPNELSPREVEIVRLIANGLSNRDISNRLILSDKTIKNHISHIFSKLSVTARTQVVIYAMRTGLA